MNVAFLRQRLIRIVTRPPEILYAVSRHWKLLVLWLSLGAALMWVKVVSEPIVYEGRALVRAEPAGPVALGGLSGMFQNLRAQDPQSFLTTQQDILLSGMVVGQLVGSLDAQSTPADQLAGGRGFSQTFRALERTTSEFLRIDRAGSQDLGREGRTKRAIKAFLQRSVVNTKPQSNALELLVYGTDRDQLEKELRSWIDAYETRAQELARQGTEEPFWGLSQHYSDVERDISGEREAYQREFPEVLNWNLDDLSSYVAQLHLHLFELRRRADGHAPIIGQNPQDPEAQQFAAEKIRAELELINTLLTRKEDSPEVQRIRRKIERLEARQSPLNATSSDTLQQQLHKQLEARSQELKNVLSVKEKLRTFDKLVRRHDDARNQQEDFQKSYNVLKSQEKVRIQEIDGPTVGTEPFGYHPFRKLLYGCLGGLGIGILLAVFLEVVCGKVRIKHDIIEDFGLPVVAVLPK